MEHRIIKLEKEIYGNDKEGLKTDVAVIKGKIKNMEERDEKIATALSGLNKYVTEQELMQSTEKERIKLKREKRNDIIIKIIMVIGILASVILGLLR